MGGEQFYTTSKGKTAKAAFEKAVKKAEYDYGHAGYTGTIAEKSEFVEIDLPEGDDPREFAEHLVGSSDERINDKWGPAGCIKIKDGEFLFFGWASS